MPTVFEHTLTILLSNFLLRRLTLPYQHVCMYVFKRDLNDDSDVSHLTSFGIEFQTEEEAKENKRSPSVALLCAGLLRRGMVYELE